jgi:pyruvate decarboxylase
VIRNLDDAHEQIDDVISMALRESKPVYISISCNLSSLPHPTFSCDPVPYFLALRSSNNLGLEAAVEAAATFLDRVVKPVMVAGHRIRVASARDALVELADVSGYAVATMPSG